MEQKLFRGENCKFLPYLKNVNLMFVCMCVVFVVAFYFFSDDYLGEKI